MKTTKLLAVIVVLQGLILIGQWTGGPSLSKSFAGGADVPDPASRQMQMVEELKTMNSKMDKLIGLIEGGDLQVKVVNADEKREPARVR
jgi:hypothetical protein